MDIAVQRTRAETFLAMHSAPELLVLCNTSDVATSRIVVEAGFSAVATSSAGVAWLLGYPDGEVISRDDMLSMVRRIADGVDVPVTADMEGGYGAAPENVAETVRQTMAAGAVGLNIEDADHAGGRSAPLLDFDLSVDRIKAGREASAAGGIHMVINARTDGFLKGGSGDETFAEAVRRGNAYAGAGADCIFVPGVRDAETIVALCREIDAPVNILAGAPSPPLPQMKELGVARVSIGGLLSLATGTLARNIARELLDAGTYGFAKDVMLHPEMNKLMAG